jgi:hypothetical protein
MMNGGPTTNALVASVFQDPDLVGVLTKMAGGVTNDPLADARVEKLVRALLISPLMVPWSLI